MTGVQTCALPICFPVTIPPPRDEHDFVFKVHFLPRDQCGNLGGGLLDHLLGHFGDENGSSIPPIQTTQVVAEDKPLDFQSRRQAALKGVILPTTRDGADEGQAGSLVICART